MSTKLENNDLNSNDAKPVLGASFHKKKQVRKFAKFMAILFVFHNDFPEWDDDVKEAIKENCNKQMELLKIPNGWQILNGYESSKEWFVENCT